MLHANDFKFVPVPGGENRWNTVVFNLSAIVPVGTVPKSLIVGASARALGGQALAAPPAGRLHLAYPTPHGVWDGGVVGDDRWLVRIVKFGGGAGVGALAAGTAPGAVVRRR